MPTPSPEEWLADFTYIWAAQGWLYAAVVLDLFSRRVVGWSMKADRDATLVMDALMMAVWRRDKGECQIFCVTVIWSMLPERSKDDDDFERTAGRVAEGLQAA